jgi:ribosome-associated protein
LSGYDGDIMEIDSEYLRYQASRSGGPGGQNVNKVNTRVTVYFDLSRYPFFSEQQKYRIRERLSTRINGQGVMRVSSQRFRTQQANRTAAVKRLHELLEQAVKRPRVRLRTKVPKAARERRLAQKKQRGQLKRFRSGRGVDNE